MLVFMVVRALLTIEPSPYLNLFRWLFCTGAAFPMNLLITCPLCSIRQSSPIHASSVTPLRTRPSRTGFMPIYKTRTCVAGSRRTTFKAVKKFMSRSTKR